MLLEFVAGFSDPASLPVLPFWEPAMFKIHLKKGKLSSRFKYPELRMENGAEVTENFGSSFSLPSSREAAEPGQARRLACGKKENSCSSLWRCGMGRARQSPGEGGCEGWGKEGGAVQYWSMGHRPVICGRRRKGRELPFRHIPYLPLLLITEFILSAMSN